MFLHDNMPKEQRKKGVCEGPKISPGDLPPQRIVKAMLTGDPYRVRAAFLQGNNGVMSYSNAKEVTKALKSLDFLVVADLFMTPTANLADVVLPVASTFEYDGIVQTSYGAQVHHKVAEVGECWPAVRIINELAKRLGLGEYFWDDEEQFLDAVLQPAHVSFQEFKKIGMMPNIKQYRSYEINGFDTPSGKVELYSSKLKGWGLDPLPIYRELPETPYSDPELAKEYPLILTNRKHRHYWHSTGRQLVSLRGQYPDPLVRIHPETAGKLGIKEGDWVYIENRRGKIKQKAVMESSLDPRVVMADYGWWFPENGVPYGWDESNINVLTRNDPPYSAEAFSTHLRSLLCKVYKIT
jgi:anaerobic selenocysteine-containing dehydrogenase